ncbi:MAG: acyl-CoA carboxylase subunit beta, partial [Actinomycetota bacterium]|nr:acyl-CoA carboxylase subunit beta [Actinomycetota bacterium]
MDEAASRLFDEGSFTPADSGTKSRDPLDWPGYRAELEKTQPGESVRSGPARIGGHEVEIALFDFSFFGGSMGEIAGERLARAMERAIEQHVPFILRTATGGARMQEGMRSLVQMPKVVAARLALSDQGIPFIAVLGNPTTGGVLASLGALADVTLAEAGATIGFAGPRVAEAFTGKELTGISHTAEAALSNGLVDEVVDPHEVHAYLTRVLNVLAHDQAVEAPSPPPTASNNEGRDAWDTVVAARAENRPRGYELLLEIADVLVELRGDRHGEDDPSLDAAIVRVEGRRMVALAMDRERVPGPGAFRKALRCIEIAARLGLPIVTFVDTRGADPGEVSESEGIAWEIAKLFEAMLIAPVPTLSIVIGEGGSGGALAFAATDVMLMYEDAIFSVIGPEMAATILWRDGTRGPEAAALLRLTGPDLVGLGVA